MTWAVALSVFSAVCYAAAAVVQERLAARGHRGRRRWAASIGLTLLGATTHTVALDFAAVGVVQALGTLTLLFALPITAVRTRTPITPGAWRDAGLTVAGLAGIMSLTTHPTAATVTGDSARYLVLATAAALVALTVLARQSTSPVLRSVLLAGASGTAFGVSSVFTKSMLVSFSMAGAVIVAVLAVSGYLLGQASYRGGGLAAPLAMVSVSNPAVAATVGVLVLGESFRFGTTGLVLAAIAAVVASAGVIGLSRRTATPTSTPTPAAADASSSALAPTRAPAAADASSSALAPTRAPAAADASTSALAPTRASAAVKTRTRTPLPASTAVQTSPPRTPVRALAGVAS